MRGTLYIVGVGPGDPELMTIKAARILEKCPVWFAPKSRQEGASTAIDIANGGVRSDNKNIITHRFPMKHVRRSESVDSELTEAWQEAATEIISYLEQGKDVAFPTLGDPAIYSTGFYVYEALASCKYDGEIKVIPGISSIGASAASANMSLCLGDERLLVLPATFENGSVAEYLKSVDAIVFMKVYRVLDRIVKLLEQENLLENAVLIEKTSYGDERIWHNVKDALGEDLHYFSTLLVRKTKS
ncbi:MAG: precorrin-2 C(20)-methyltransferase [Desulfotalea sp.]